MGEAEAAEDAVHVLLGVTGFGAAWLGWFRLVRVERWRCGRWCGGRCWCGWSKKLGVGDGREGAEVGVEDDLLDEVLEEFVVGGLFLDFEGEWTSRSRSFRCAPG